MTLNRRDQILKYIVEHFVKTAQPVGSQTLIDEYHLRYSSATIRNEMNSLEQMGYLEKTHSSSGRVPSAEGYRFYCEYLRDKSIDDDFKIMVSKVLEEKTKSIDEVIKASCQILSHMTSMASVILGPSVGEEKLASIQCIPLSDNSASIVFVTNQGFVQNKTVVLQDEKTSMNDLVKCMKLFNERLVGTPLCDLVDKTEALRPVLSEYIVNHEIVYKAMLEAFLKFAGDRLALYGKNELFDQPEFSSNASSLKALLKILESPEDLKYTAKNSESDYKEGNITLHIGAKDSESPDVSIVTTKLKIGDMPEGTIALVGPKRMDYDKVISALEFLVEQINEYYKKED